MEPGFPLDPANFAQVIRAAPLVSIDLLVSDGQDRVLLGRRSNAPARGMWFVPGGRIHKGERLDQALARVILEELGPEATPLTVEFRGIFDHFYEENYFGDPDYGTHYVVLAHQVVVERLPQNLPQAQHLEFGWWPIAQLLASSEVHPYTKTYFR